MTAGLRPEQPYEAYTADDHRAWQILYERQKSALTRHAAPAFVEGIEKLELSSTRVPDFISLNRALAATTGWRIAAVNGLISDRAFFECLANRIFPVTWWMRGLAQLDYLEEPDLFHDLFGHVPMLMHAPFADFMQAYGRHGLRADQLGALESLSRLYWYTVEFGLIQDARVPGGLAIYGAGIASSSGETRHSLARGDDAPRRLRFDVDRVMQTRFRTDVFQQTYFVIESFEQLFAAVDRDLGEWLVAPRDGPEYAPGEGGGAHDWADLTSGNIAFAA